MLENENNESMERDSVNQNKEEVSTGDFIDLNKENKEEPVMLPMCEEIVNNPVSDTAVEVNSSPVYSEPCGNTQQTVVGTPLAPFNKKNKETSVDVMKKQNTLLKVICACLCVCVISQCMFGLINTTSKSESNIYVSDMGSNRIVTNIVKGENSPLSTAQIYSENLESVVSIHTEIVTQGLFGQSVGYASGSGFVISEDGYVLTNHHVIEGASTITVVMSNGSEYSAKLIGSEEDSDVAVLKIDAEGVFNPVVLGDSDKLIIGEDVLAIGNPLGELTFSVTKGIVSALDRDIQIDNFTAINMFQVDCAVNEGNSGGPVFNMYGEVVGIVSAKYASETIEGLGFCIPINDVAIIVSDLVEHGKVINKAYMGIQVADVDETMISHYNMVAGAYVSIIEEGSCAEKSGLKVGDIIVEFNGETVESVSDLLSAKRNFRAGDTTTFKVYRSGGYVDLTITFDEYVEEEVVNTQENNNQMTQEELNDLYEFFKNYQNGNYGNNSNMPSIEDFFNDYFGGYGR